MKISENRRKMLKIVMLYYEQGLTQAEIARKMNISRPVISKILQQAKEEGIVTITIKDESSYAVNLGLKLEKKYGLKEVIVVAANEHSPKETTQRKISLAAAAFFEQQLKPQLKVGLSWGTTLADMIDVLPYFSYPSMKIFPLVGGVSSDHLYFDTNHLVFRLAEKLNGQCQYFYAPALAENQLLADTLNQSHLLKQLISDAKNVDIAIIGVGNPNENSTWRKLNYWKKEELDVIQMSNIMGDAVASLFDKAGQTVNNSISQRMLGIKVEDLASIPEVMVIAYGVEKVESIQPLLVSKSCSILVIDQLIAEKLIRF